MEEMTLTEKARIILDSLDEYLQIDYNFESLYMSAIRNGLKKIDVIQESRAQDLQQEGSV